MEHYLGIYDTSPRMLSIPYQVPHIPKMGE